MGNALKSLARTYWPVLLVIGLGGVLAFAIKPEIDKRDEIRGLVKALDAVGISRTNASGVLTDRVIYRGVEHDVNGDGIKDYRILLKQSDGTYSERVVLGVK